MSTDLWAVIPKGDVPCAEEKEMFNSLHIKQHNTIQFHRIYVSESVERLVFANGSVFERKVKE